MITFSFLYMSHDDSVSRFKTCDTTVSECVRVCVSVCTCVYCTLSVGRDDLLHLLRCSGGQDLHQDLLVRSCPLEARQGKTPLAPFAL